MLCRVRSVESRLQAELTRQSVQIHHHIHPIQRTPVERLLNIRNLLLADVWLVRGNVVNPIRDRNPNGVQPIVGHPLKVIFRNPGIPVFFENLSRKKSALIGMRTTMN
jgi:hypothetical protein